jgi:hypothetical protein
VIKRPGRCAGGLPERRAGGLFGAMERLHRSKAGIAPEFTQAMLRLRPVATVINGVPGHPSYSTKEIPGGPVSCAPANTLNIDRTPDGLKIFNPQSIRWFIEFDSFQALIFPPASQ